MKILFWLLIAADVAALLVFLLLGLATASSSKTNPVFGAVYMLSIPVLILITAVLLFTRSSSPLGRGAALLLAGAPALVIFALRGIESVKLLQNTNASGELAYFRAGPLRDIAQAVARNDTATIISLLPGVDVNKRGYAKTTLLALALRQLEDTPQETAAIRLLLKAGADPNLPADELPLELAMQHARQTGAEPARMLLEAGANPNARDHFGDPVFFSGVGPDMPPDLLATLLLHGADLKLTDRTGRTIVFQAVDSSNWKAALLLLERGVDYKSARTVNGETFVDLVESRVRVFGDTGGVAEVVAYLKRQ
jgi:hypothetical protein